MRTGVWIVTFAAASVFALAGTASAEAARGPSEMNKGLSPEVEEPMELTDAQVKGFFDAADEMRATRKDGDQADPKGYQALGTTKENLAIIQKHGFKDTTEFQRVGYNAALAYNVLQQGGKDAIKARVEKNRQQQRDSLEKLRPKVTKEQFKELEKQVATATSMAKPLLAVPDGNIEIMKKYSDRMKHTEEKD